MVLQKSPWAVNESALAGPAEIANRAIAETQPHPRIDMPDIDLIIVFPLPSIEPPRGFQRSPVSGIDDLDPSGRSALTKTVVLNPQQFFESHGQGFVNAGPAICRV